MVELTRKVKDRPVISISAYQHFTEGKLITVGHQQCQMPYHGKQHTKNVELRSLATMIWNDCIYATSSNTGNLLITRRI